MIPHQRRTSPPRGVPRMPPQQPHPALHQAPPQQLGAPPQQQVGHPYPAPIGNEGYRGVDEGEVRRLQDELAHKEAVLKQLEVQFDLYKEEHAKLLASKIEEQREAFNVEKDRINQHFIRTGQELHAKTEELHQQIADNERLKTKNKNLTDWLDKGVEECKRVADENERLKQDLLEARGAVQRSDADIARRLAQAEMERDNERAEREGTQAAMQSLQERIREMEVQAEEDRRNFAEVATQARRMKRRLGQLKAVVDRFCGVGQADPLGQFDELDLQAFDDMEGPGVPERQQARDALFHVHEGLNGLQTSCRKLMETGNAASTNDVNETGMYSLRQQLEKMMMENETLEHKMKRKQEELDSLEQTAQHVKSRNEQQRTELEQELDEARRQKNQATFDADTARSEANRLRDELEQSRLALERLAQQDEAAQRRATELDEDLRKLSQEMIGIRDYGLQLERQNSELEREAATLRDKASRAGDENSDLNKQLQSQVEQQRVQYQDLQDKHNAAQAEANTNRQQVAVLEERINNLLQQLAAMPAGQPATQPAGQPVGVTISVPAAAAPATTAPAAAPFTPAPTPSGTKMHWGNEPDDYGYASPLHAKITCPLCATEGFIPGAPCRNCGHSTGQFTRLVDGATPGAASTAPAPAAGSYPVYSAAAGSVPHTPAYPQPHGQSTHLQPPASGSMAPNRVSPVRWN